MNKPAPNDNPAQAGYEYLIGYKLTVVVYDNTVVFCRRFFVSNSSYLPNLPNQPYAQHSRSRDQMEQAARSGMTNIPEGYKQNSLAGYIKLAGVARGSLAELLNDYLALARQNKVSIWPKERAIREINEIGEIWEIIKNTPTLPINPNFPDLPNSLEKTINLQITLINQANYFIDKLIESLNQKFVKEGGFSENLLRKRLEERNKNK